MNTPSIPALPGQIFSNVIQTMKTRPVQARRWRPAFIPVLALATLAVVLGSSRLLAQGTPNPPERLTYQGFLVDGNGVALGNDAPKNYDVIFRLYNEQSDGDLLWAEQQTVTVDKGYFSVLLGEGADAGPPRPLLSTLFRGPTASDRFVGITVKGIGASGANVDILPRLRLLSSPYAFLAQNAVKLVQDTGADLITSSANAVTVGGPLTATSLSGNGANVTGINAKNITDGTLPNERTSATPANAAGTIVARDSSGGFAMGNLSAGALQAAGNQTTHPQGAYLEWNKAGGDGMSYLLNQKGLGNGGLVFGEVSAENTISEWMRLDSAGNLGLGAPSTGTRLEVAGSVGITGNNVLELGRGASKDAVAGNIAYRRYSDALDIVGAGTAANGSDRKIKLWSEGGLDLNGFTTISTPSNVPFTVYGNKGLTFAVADSQLLGFHPTDKTQRFSLWRVDEGVMLTVMGGRFGDFRNTTWGGDGWYNGSDRKLKKDIVDAEPMLERALQVQVRRFRWKDSAADSKLSMGVIAQELQPLFPDSVSTQENPTTKEMNLSVGYSDFGLIAVKALQEFKAQHDAEMAELKAQMAEVIQANKALRSRLDKGVASNTAGR